MAMAMAKEKGNKKMRPALPSIGELYNDKNEC